MNEKSPIDKALDAATILLTEDHYLVEAIEAWRRGREFFRPDYDRELISVRDHLAKVEMEASEAARLCRVVGFARMEELCKKIEHRIWQARIAGRDDPPAIHDLSRLTVAGQEELDLLIDNNEGLTSHNTVTVQK